MAESTYEFTGKSVDEAVAEALAQLEVSRGDVAVEVLSKGSRGIFGIGSEPARVRVTLEPTSDTPSSTPVVVVEESVEATSSESLPESENGAFDDESSSEEQSEAVAEEVIVTEAIAVAESDDESSVESAEKSSSGTDGVPIDDDELAAMASEMLSEVVRLMGFEAVVVSSWQEQDDDSSASYLLLDIEGGDLGALIGRRGETLASLQYLVRLMVNQRIKQWRNIVVDVEKYKERRENQLNQLALRMADQVAESGRATALEPMPPNERRIVHLALRDHELVYTQSSGEGERRKVNIVPRDTA